MTLAWVRDYYGVPAKRGGRVRHTYESGIKREGTITSARNGCLRIRLDGESRAYVFHPTWRLEYLP